MAATRLYAASPLARAVRRSHSWCASTTTLLRSRQQFLAVQCTNTASVAAVLRQWQQRSVSTLACVRQRAAPQQHGWKEEEEEDEQHGSTDTVKEIAEVANTKGDLVVFKDGKKVRIQSMPAPHSHSHSPRTTRQWPPFIQWSRACRGWVCKHLVYYGICSVHREWSWPCATL